MCCGQSKSSPRLFTSQLYLFVVKEQTHGFRRGNSLCNIADITTKIWFTDEFVLNFAKRICIEMTVIASCACLILQQFNVVFIFTWEMK